MFLTLYPKENFVFTRISSLMFLKIKVVQSRLSWFEMNKKKTGTINVE